MKIRVDKNASTPVFRQIVDQVHFAINSGDLTPDSKLPSIRSLAHANSIATNTVAKAYRQLEFRGIVEARDRSVYRVSGNRIADTSRYQARGVSADKTEVHDAVDKLDGGVVPGAFCKITEDFLSGDPYKCNVIHADGSGSKSIIAYLHYKETGDPSVFHGIAQDSIVMNLDDLLCVGVNDRILFSSTINRNALNCPGEVVNALIQGAEAFMANMRDHGVDLFSGGGETADVGDLTGTVVVDSCAVAIMHKDRVITNDIRPGLAIIGLASAGQSTYEDTENSGIGSNGLTSARHDMLHDDYARRYPESYDSNMPKDLVYCGPWRLDDRLPDSSLSIGAALLSPTRSYAPVVQVLLAEMADAVNGIIHCSGGAQTKCLKFGSGVHFVKDDLFPPPVVFNAIQSASGTDWKEMYKVFNMGHRMEIYVPPSKTNEVIDIAQSFNIPARQIGFTERANDNQLTLTDCHGNMHRFTAVSAQSVSEP